MRDKKVDVNVIGDREKLAARKIMEGLTAAAKSLADAKEWSRELEDIHEWYQESFGIDKAALGICEQIASSYLTLCEAYGIEHPDIQEGKE